MANQQNLKDIFKKNQYDLKIAANRSKSWFQQQARMLQLQNPTPTKVLNGDPSRNVSTIQPGSLYMFLYDPKTKEDLPYYDVFPLVFPFKKTQDGFIGLNMHYLPYPLRITLLDNLLIYRSNTRMDDMTKLKYSWQIIDGVSRFAAAKPCVKQYLSNHVRSQFRQITSKDWATAMLLPVERFVGASKAEVWADSKKIIRKA